jgi:hypothetical protein
MSESFSPADEPTRIGRELIKRHHKYLTSRRVDFLFVERFDGEGNAQSITRKGKNVYGKAKLLTGLSSFLATPEGQEASPFFVILISKCFWDTASQEFKHALIDHELCHCFYDADADKYSLIDHDIDEFIVIVRRHGLWHHDIETFVHTASQQSLKFDEVTTAKSRRAARLEH